MLRILLFTPWTKQYGKIIWIFLAAAS